MRQFHINLSLSLLSVVFTLFLLELITHVFLPPTQLTYINLNSKRWNINDKERSYKLNPGYMGKLKSTEFENDIFVNSYGFRDISNYPSFLENPLNDNIFIIGDSFIFGVGVDYKNTIPANVEYDLNGFNVFNLGTPSYALDDYYVTLNQFLKYDPTFVVVSIFAGKLFGGADDIYATKKIKNQKMLQEKKEIEIKLKNDPSLIKNKIKSLKKILSRHSALYNFTLLHFGTYMRSKKSSLIDLNDEIIKKREIGYQIYSNFLDELKKISEKKDFRTIILHIPPESDITNNYTETRDRILEITKSKNLDCIDGFSILKKHKNIYYPIDGHLNSSGNKIISKEISEMIIKYSE